MQSLLSPSESHAFQSFLSNMDFADDSITPSEWAIYNSEGQTYHGHDDPSQDTDTNPEHREALTKATKDLMSLDADGWDDAGAMMNRNSGSMNQTYDARGQYDQQQQEHRFSHQQHVMHQEQRLQQHMQQEHQRQSAFSSGSDLFPFLHSKAHQQLPTQELRYPMQHQHEQHRSHLNMSSMNTSNSDPGSPTTSSHPFSGFQPDSRTIALRQQQNTQRQNQPHQVLIPSHPDQQRGMSPTSGTATRNKRQSTRSSSSLARSESTSLPHSTSDPNSNVTSTSSNSIRSNLSINGNAKRARSATSPSISSNNALVQQQQIMTNPKQTLLSPSQKKANHIQSEQKRRANIRRGYEALCETVPALREAIREEEEAERNAANGQRGAGNSTQRKKSRGKKGSKDSDEKDRLDGRAGPRSENVVLSKTIDHIQALIADRSALLARLHRARSSLPPGHPALMSLVTDPPWEREWKGGNGRLGDEDPEGEGSDGEEDEDGE